MGFGAPAVGWTTWSIKRWLDGRYERRRSQTEEARKHRIEAIAREVLSSSILHEYTKSTTTTALNSPEHTTSVESVIANSIPIQRVIDARFAHGWNNHQYDLDKMIRDRLTESNAPILAAIEKLSEAVIEIKISCAGHRD
jgi:hypothetical protein